MGIIDEVFLHECAWKRTFKGWNIVDCAVRSRNIIYLILRKSLGDAETSEKWDFDIPTRFVGLYLAETDIGERWSHQGLSGFRMPHAGACSAPQPQGLALSANGNVYAAGSGAKGLENVTDEPTYLVKLRRIGVHTYAVGIGRDVFRRDAIGHWTRLDGRLPVLSSDELSPAIGFGDIDGFFEDDIYAVGGYGDLWHFDGKFWSQRLLPANSPLFTVCCAGDGQVYVTGEKGTIFRGRDDHWQKIWDGSQSIPYNDSLWFADKLWLASDYRLDWLVQTKDGCSVEVAKYRGNRLHLRGHMDIGDGVLVIASLDTVWLFDGESWRKLVAPYGALPHEEEGVYNSDDS